MSEKEKYEKIIGALKKIASSILPKGSRMCLYGSRARADAREDSDWDLHIVIPGEEKITWDLWDLYAWPFSDEGLKYDAIINPRLYSIVGWEKRSFLPFYKEVEKDKIILYQS